MRERMNTKTMNVLILVALAVLEGCLIQEDPFRPIISEYLEQCVTPLYTCSSFDVRPDGFSLTSDITLSADGEYIVAAEYGTLSLFVKKGNELWSKKVSDTYINRIAVSSHCEYIAINTEEVSLFPVSAFEVYNKKGELLWRYEEEHPFTAIAVGGDGHYLVAGSDFLLLFFDNFQAIEEYAQSECAQQDTLTLCCL